MISTLISPLEPDGTALEHEVTTFGYNGLALDLTCKGQVKGQAIRSGQKSRHHTQGQSVGLKGLKEELTRDEHDWGKVVCVDTRRVLFWAVSWMYGG